MTASCRTLILTAAAAIGISACSSQVVGDINVAPEDEDLSGTELDIGERSDGGDGNMATRCKLPLLPDGRPDFDAIGFARLIDPEIVVSVDGLSLRLIDRASDYEKIFPVGVGAISQKETEFSFGESYTMDPVTLAGDNRFTIDASNTQKGNWNNNPCRVWWVNSDNTEEVEMLPVFAGLPFLRLQHPTASVGAYGIHGPITNYNQADGGDLKRGYVSHGCVRMDGADLTELYARVRGNPAVPVTIQRSPERDVEGVRVDIDDKWIGSECQLDSDCNYQGGYCENNAISGRGFCTQRCTESCPDKFGYPVTYCVDDLNAPELGMCTIKVGAQNFECRSSDHMQPSHRARHDQSGSATVCMPATRGWVGDLCLDDGDCISGGSCSTNPRGKRSCTRDCIGTSLGVPVCQDIPGAPDTLCVDDFFDTQPTCYRQCSPDNYDADCAPGFGCFPGSRTGTESLHFVCAPL